MRLFNLLARLNLHYSDPKEEAEYVQTKIPIVKNFLTYLISGIMAMLIPVAIHFFLIVHDPIRGYAALAMLIVALLLFIGRNFLGRWLEYFVVVYLLCIVGLLIFNITQVLLSLKICESFYSGYAFALLHRILGYRIVNTYSMVIFHAISLTLRLVILYDHNLSVTLMVTALEVITVGLSFKSEVGERSLFDSLYKSKCQLVKFKDFLTEHLPNQMIILDKDNSSTYFMNEPFEKAFDCEDISQAQQALCKLTIEKDSIQKNSILAEKLSELSPKKGQLVSLAQVINFFSKSGNFVENPESLSFQVCEVEQIPQSATTNGIVSRGDSCEEDKVLNSHEVPLQNLKEDRIIINVVEAPANAEQSPNNKKKREGEEKVRRTFKVKIFLLPWDGKEAIALILDDITQQKTIMELQVADKNKDLVIAMVSHELRTPLNGMLGLIDILKKKISNKEATAYLNACKNSGVFLLNLVNSILDMSQIKNNKLKLVYTKVCLVELLEEVKSFFESFCTTKGLYLNIVVEKDVPINIMTDRSRLSQILINLLGNSFKFTFVGGVTIRVETERLQSPYKLRFFIQDTGLGIKKEDQDKLFKLFGKLEQKDKSVNASGVGLGLNISNTLAMLLNPSESQGIRVESELGKGSTFSFLIESEVEPPSDDKMLSNLPSGLESNSFESVEEEFLPLSSKLFYYKTNRGFMFNQRMMSFQKSPTMDNDDGSSTDHSALLKKQPKFSTAFSLATPLNPADLQNKKLSQNMRFLNTENIINLPQIEQQQQQKSEPASWCLIVDDNPFNSMVARHIMQEKKYEIKTALNGKEAIEEIKKHYDSGKILNVALMDCQMPVMDGYEATRILKAMMKEGQIDEFPIIALTANNRDEEHERLCQEVGMCGVVSKPLQTTELECILKKLKKKI